MSSLLARIFSSTTLFVAMLCLLAFVAGTLIAWGRVFPYEPLLRRAFIGLEAIWLQYLAPQEPFAADAWMSAEGLVGGVRYHDPSLAFAGYTLVTFGQEAQLLGMDGQAVHSWTFSYEQILAATDEIGPQVPETWIYWNNARLYPNGDLVVVVAAWETSPVGIALIKIDRSSKLLWVYRQHVHHDLDIDAEGNLYLLDQQVREQRPAQLWALNEPLLDEHVVVLSPDGKELRRVSILDAFAASEYVMLLNRIGPTNVRRWGDYLHNNNVELVTPQIAPNFPFLKPGQVLLSMRELDTIAALDLDEGKIVWAARGPWHLQHDPDLLANGHMLVFDNQGDWAHDGQSRVIEIDPQSNAIVWSYPSTAGGSLWTAYRGEQQELPNGNILINEFLQGRLLEVTRAGQTAWEFVSPFHYERDASYVGRMMSAKRYSAAEVSFLKGELD